MTSNFLSTFESAILPRLIDWAKIAIEKSLGQPVLPHLIVAVNKNDLSIDKDQWDVKRATNIFFGDFQNTFENVTGSLKESVEYWRSKGKALRTTKEFLECYYSSVTIVRLPDKGSYMLMHEQVGKLFREISKKSNDSQYMKRRLRMLANGEDLQLYLESAFNHFACDLEAPFDIVKTGRMINPTSRSFCQNIVKLAAAVMDEGLHGNDFDTISFQIGRFVGSCIMIDIHRKRHMGKSI